MNFLLIRHDDREDALTVIDYYESLELLDSFLKAAGLNTDFVGRDNYLSADVPEILNSGEIKTLVECWCKLNNESFTWSEV